MARACGPISTPTTERPPLFASTAVRRAALIVDRGDDAFILKLELLVEGEPGQRALLNDGKRSQHAAADRHRQRDRKDEARGDRSKLEHDAEPFVRVWQSSSDAQTLD